MFEKKLKYLFYFLSAVLLAIMLISARNAGISCDEVLHYNHSVSVYNYFASHGADKSALNTPVTNLKFYGQSYDNIVTIVTKWFHIKDVYSFRHLMSVVAGWLAIIVTALFALWLNGYLTGIFVLVLFAVSPTFFGHSLNNLKDIPFALGYISSCFFILKFLFSHKKFPTGLIILLVLSIAFTISIRAGGLITICYFFIFFIIIRMLKFSREKRFEFPEILKSIGLITIISVSAWFLSILLWPYALQHPVKNVIESYNVMAHFPSTFRQIFEGKVEWSDFVPWYYLPKSMMITIPLAVLSGVLLFLILVWRVTDRSSIIKYGFIVFTVLFPMAFVVYEKSNLYSSWRQFLFLYPAIILLAATGLNLLFETLSRKVFTAGVLVLVAGLSVHPIFFMLKNSPYYYLYYNQLTRGLRGAYTKYETDYYFTGQTEASKWLINYLKEKNIRDSVKVSATYPVDWQFRNNPEIRTSYFRYEERSLSDWDYAIVTNRYISPFQLKNRAWPPAEAIYTVYVDEVPICAVFKRKSKDDFYGYKALLAGKFSEAIAYYRKVLTVNHCDEMIFYNFAAALYNDGQVSEADSVLKKGLEINPGFEPILMYLGNIARSKNRNEEAIIYYKRVIELNRKYFEAYVGLAEIEGGRDIMMARSILRDCITMSPRYKPAIKALADTYRISDPEIAEKYDKLASSIK